MADIKLFRYKPEVKELTASSVLLEKELQNVIEKNMPEFFDMKTVSTRAGHSKASTTSDFYSHFIKNSDIHASEILNKIFE